MLTSSSIVSLVTLILCIGIGAAIGALVVDNNAADAIAIADADADAARSVKSFSVLSRPIDLKVSA